MFLEFLLSLPTWTECFISTTLLYLYKKIYVEHSSPGSLMTAHILWAVTPRVLCQPRGLRNSFKKSRQCFLSVFVFSVVFNCFFFSILFLPSTTIKIKSSSGRKIRRSIHSLLKENLIFKFVISEHCSKFT